ncbi:MAG: hypothetical protein SGJ00_05510 [bacterium]|nr:hypothetical protein [bacterium]
MKIPIQIAESLLLLSLGETIANGSAKHVLIDELVREGILERNGRIKKNLRLQDVKALNTYLENQCAIYNLKDYIILSQKEEVTRAELVSVSSDSKLVKVRTFKGFLINCFSPVKATLNGKQIVLNPAEGTFQFIYDFESFFPSQDTLIVGVENPESFRHIHAQTYLFPKTNLLFVSRYPQNQSKDLLKWLQSIPNHYLHFGDFDFAGIGIFINEFKRYLLGKSKFYVPKNIESLLKQYGNKDRYNNQKINFDANLIEEESLVKLIKLIHHYRKGLDQEILINQDVVINSTHSSLRI